MCRNVNVLFITLMVGFMLGFNGIAQTKSDTTSGKKSDRVTLLTYVRVISDTKGSVRVDENIVPTFKLVDWLNLQVGFRYGERPQNINSYYHYKIELQSKWFGGKSKFHARAFARLSDNIITAPAPTYSKTNKLAVIEAKYALSSRFLATVGGGYCLSSQQNNVTDATPSNSGTQLNYPLFKFAIRYVLKNKSFFEATYGSYDVFNPYYYKSPFAQISTEQEISPLITFYGYFRYQYQDSNFFTPYNYFFCAGVKIHLFKK